MGLQPGAESIQIKMAKLVKIQNRALHFIYGKHIPQVQDQKLLTIERQLMYNDLLLFK